MSLFKSHLVQTGEWQPALIFSSSGTTGASTSRHAVRSSEWYNRVSTDIFESFYGSLSNWTILALLPSYLERGGSSLIHMVSSFIEASGNASHSGFFLNDFGSLSDRLQECRREHRQTLLIGVSYALLDLAESFPQDLSGITVMETGGMKGRRREITRSELHDQLIAALNLEVIHSEYGMTELFSQAYALGNGRFRPGFSMRVLPRQITDPLEAEALGRTAALNIVDLANIDTCSFIATDDLGRCFPDGSFEVLGRLDGSDIRGCNLLVADVNPS